MKVQEYNSSFEVSLTKDDLEKAFSSETDFQLLLHTVVLSTYGKELADKLFPIE